MTRHITNKQIHRKQARMPLRTSRSIKIPIGETSAFRQPKRDASNATSEAKTKKPRVKPSAGSHEIVAGQFIQRRSNWCWATCARMVANSLAIGLSADQIPEQEEIVRTWHGSVENVTQNADQIVALYRSGILGVPIECRQTPGSLFQQMILNELGEDRPVQIGITFLGGGGHVVVVAGFADMGDGTVRYIIHDPASGQHVVSFGELCHGGWIAPGNWIVSFHRFGRL